MLDNSDTLLVTGASGMVGTVLTELLKKKGFRAVLTPSSNKGD